MSTSSTIDLAAKAGVQTIPVVSVSALRERALAAAGVRGTFANLIDGKSIGARNSLDVLDPATEIGRAHV